MTKLLIDAPVGPAPGSIVGGVDLAAHRADMERRQAEMDARRPELMRCLNPAYAAKKERAKPAWRYSVSAAWVGPDEGRPTSFDSMQVVIAQNEQDAWAQFCDKVQHWPSIRDAKPTFVRGKQVSIEEKFSDPGDDIDSELPRQTIGPAAKPRRY